MELYLHCPVKLHGTETNLFHYLYDTLYYLMASLVMFLCVDVNNVVCSDSLICDGVLYFIICTGLYDN
jgi:hypothetical protein